MQDFLCYQLKKFYNNESKQSIKSHKPAYLVKKFIVRKVVMEMYTITEYELEQVIKHSEELASCIVESEKGLLFYKIFASFAAKMIDVGFSFDEEILSSKESMINSLARIICEMVVIASEDTIIKI